MSPPTDVPQPTAGSAPGALRDSLTRVLKELSCHKATQRLRSDIFAQTSPAALVPELERLTARHRSTGD